MEYRIRTHLYGYQVVSIDRSKDYNDPKWLSVLFESQCFDDCYRFLKRNIDIQKSFDII